MSFSDLNEIDISKSDTNSLYNEQFWGKYFELSFTLSMEH
jgi:hypothetical protein